MPSMMMNPAMIAGVNPMMAAMMNYNRMMTNSSSSSSDSSSSSGSSAASEDDRPAERPRRPPLPVLENRPHRRVPTDLALRDPTVNASSTKVRKKVRRLPVDAVAS